MAWGGAASARDRITIDEALCDGCGACVPACADGAIAVVDGKARLVREAACDGLGACLPECPRGAITLERGAPSVAADVPAMTRAVAGETPASFRQWPLQLHLVSARARFFRGADLLLAADCVAYAVDDFRRAHLVGRSLAIACPKLDVGQDAYLATLVSLLDEAEVASLTVMVMEVPCCGGLVRLARAAAARSRRKLPVRAVVVAVDGTIVRDAVVADGGSKRGASLPLAR